MARNLLCSAVATLLITNTPWNSSHAAQLDAEGDAASRVPRSAEGTQAPAQVPARPPRAKGLPNSEALRATVFGTPPQDLAPLPKEVPLEEISIELPWAQPVPPLYWFDKRLQAWLAPQDHPAPLAILISGTGSDGNTSRISTLRAALYGAGYHVLSLPSPTFPGFIVAASSTGVAGDLMQDSHDLYNAAERIVSRLRRRIQITDVDVLGYSLGGANAAVLKAIDAKEGKLAIHRALMINPPVSLFDSMERLDQLFTQSIGPTDADFDLLYRRLYARLANLYRSHNIVHVETSDMLAAAGSVLKSDKDLAAAIALTFRIALVDVFLAGDLYARTGVVVDPAHPPGPNDSLDSIGATLRKKPFDDYFNQVFAPYYIAHRPHTTASSLRATSGLNDIADALRNDPDYYAQTNKDDLILDPAELDWLRTQMGTRIAVYDQGGHLGNLGSKQQVSDMLTMLAGRWQGRQQ